MPQNPNVCMSLAILDLDTSAVPVMFLDASPRSVTEAAVLSSMPFRTALRKYVHKTLIKLIVHHVMK
jgi:hypothetical protein